MPRISTFVTVLALGCLASSAALGQGISDGLIPFSVLNSQGLEREWETHAQVDPSYGRLDFGSVHVNSTKSLTHYVISYGNQREVIRETDINPKGEPYGVLGARDAADLRVEILAAEGIDAEVTEKVMPQITLYLLSDQFVVQAIDGETGATKWATQVGTRDWPTTQLGVSDDYVCLTNGMTLYCLDAASGSILWERQMSNSSGGGPVITKDLVYVPKVNGTLESFSLTDPKKPSDQLVSFGRAMTSPLLTALGNVVWISDRNTLFVAPTGTEVAKISYRISFDRPISGNVAAGENDTLVVGTDDGAVHCFSEARGALLWKQFISNPLRQQPVVIGDDVFLVALGHRLSVLSLETGSEKWTVENIQQVLTVSGDRVFATDNLSRLIVLDRLTGRLISTIGRGNLNFAVSNGVSDRIYIGTRSGTIQCIRDLNKHEVELHVSLDLKPNLPVEEPVDETTRPVRPRVTEPVEPETDPFGVKKEDDPFGID